MGTHHFQFTTSSSVQRAAMWIATPYVGSPYGRCLCPPPVDSLWRGRRRGHTLAPIRKLVGVVGTHHFLFRPVSSAEVCPRCCSDGALHGLLLCPPCVRGRVGLRQVGWARSMWLPRQRLAGSLSCVQEVRYAVAATRVGPASDVIDDRGANSASLK